MRKRKKLAIITKQQTNVVDEIIFLRIMSTRKKWDRENRTENKSETGEARPFFASTKHKNWRLTDYSQKSNIYWPR